MLRVFLRGLAFGTGFSIAFVVVWFVSAWFVSPLLFGSYEHIPLQEQSHSTRAESASDLGKQFHELSLEERIERSSVIAIARYKPAADGKLRAVIAEILKHEPDTQFYYAVGDEYPSLSFYPRENESRGDGLVIFFVGSPANMQMAMSFDGDRIRSLGDLPLEMLRTKCSPS